MKTNFYTTYFSLKHSANKGLLLGVILLFTAIAVQAQQWTPNDPNNIALHKPAKQSSVYEVAAANRAVDGNTNGDWGKRSVTHTHGEDNPWWEVDLLGVYDISSITIYNRTDCCPDRLKNFTIRVSDQPLKGRNGGQVFNNDRNTFTGSKTFTGNVRGRYVSIQLGDKGILSLAEVVVNGKLISELGDNINLALGKSTRQSSVYDWSSSNKANDGDIDGHWNMGSVMHTNKDNKAFWEVDLGRVYLVKNVKIYNRTDGWKDRLNNFEIYVTEKPYEDVRVNLEPFASEEKNFLPNDSKSYSGNSLGRYVRVQLNGQNHLNLAEVQVFGERLGDLELNMPEITRIEYRVSAYRNGGSTEVPRESLVATAITEGYDFSKTTETSDTKYWEITSEISTSVDVLLHSFDVSIGAKGGGSTTNSQSITQNNKLEESITLTEKDTEIVPANTTKYKLVKFSIREKPFVYRFDGKEYRFSKVLEGSRPLSDVTILEYPFNFNPGFNTAEVEKISQRKYDSILANYGAEQKRFDVVSQNNQNTSNTNTSSMASNTNSNIPATTNQSITSSNASTNTNVNTNTPKVSQVEYCNANGTPTGYFTLVDGVWKEHDMDGNVSNEFSEGSRNASEIVLNDLNRGGVTIKLDIANRKVWYSDTNNNPFELYDISNILMQ